MCASLLETVIAPKLCCSPEDLVFNLKSAIVAAAASSIVLMSAAAATAASYEDPAFQLTVHNPILTGGHAIRGSVDADQLQCDFTVTFRGQTLTHTGAHFDFSFATPEVTRKTQSQVVSTCAYDDGNTNGALTRSTGSTAVRPAVYVSSANAVLPVVIQTLTHRATVTLLPEGDGGAVSSDALPDTGGPNQGILMLGGALVAFGSAAALVSRRKREQAA